MERGGDYIFNREMIYSLNEPPLATLQCTNSNDVVKMIMRIWFSQHNLNSFALSRLNTVAMPHLMREACVQRAYVSLFSPLISPLHTHVYIYRRSPSSLSTRAHTSRKEDDTRERDKAEAQKPEKKGECRLHPTNASGGRRINNNKHHHHHYHY